MIRQPDEPVKCAAIASLAEGVLERLTAMLPLSRSAYVITTDQQIIIVKQSWRFRPSKTIAVAQLRDTKLARDRRKAFRRILWLELDNRTLRLEFNNFFLDEAATIVANLGY